MKRFRRAVNRFLGEESEPRAVVSSRPARAVLLMGVVAYLAFFTAWSLDNHWGFATFGFDLGIFDQGVWLLSRFSTPFVTVRGLHLFGDHSSFILILMAPLYWVFSTPAVLLVVQSLALGLAAVPVFMIAREKLRNELMATGLALAYLAQPALQWTNLENFHPDSFEVLLLFIALYTMLTRRWRFFLASVVLLLLVKEDVALTTFALGAFVAVSYARRVGLLTMGISVGWFAAIYFWIIPNFSEGGALYADRLTGRFGGFGGLIETAFRRPWELVAIAFEPEKRTYLWQLLAPLALLPVASGLILVAIPALALNVLTTFGYQHDIRYHYSTLILPLLVTATIFAIARLRDERWRFALVGAVLLCALTGSYLWGPAGRGDGPRAPRGTPFVAAAREAVEMIPSDASVSAHYLFVPHLTHREEIFQFPNPWMASNWGDGSVEGTELPYTADIDYLILRDPVEGENAALIERLKSTDFEQAFSAEGITVLERRDG